MSSSCKTWTSGSTALITNYISYRLQTPKPTAPTDLVTSLPCFPNLGSLNLSTPTINTSVWGHRDWREVESLVMSNPQTKVNFQTITVKWSLSALCFTTACFQVALFTGRHATKLLWSRPFRFLLLPPTTASSLCVFCPNMSCFNYHVWGRKAPSVVTAHTVSSMMSIH